MAIHEKRFTKTKRPYKSYINASWTRDEVLMI